MALTTFSKDFKGTVQKFLPLNCGIPESLRNSVSPQYIVHIVTENSQAGAEQHQVGPSKTEIWAYLQDNVEVRIGSTWEGLSEIFGDVKKMADIIMQAGTSLVGGGVTGTRSLVSQVSSRRKWSGTTPITLTIPLKFEAVDNVDAEVLQPCLALQQLCAPRAGDITGSFFLIPPGPSPFEIPKIKDAIGDQTTITIGNFFTLEKAIIEDVTVTYDTRMSLLGPIGASAKITVSGYEIPTKQGLAEMYNQPQSIQSADMNKSLGIRPSN